MTYRKIILPVVLAMLLAGCGGAQPTSPVSTPDLTTVEEGEALIEQGDFQGARDVFQKITTRDPNNARAQFYLGFCLSNLGDSDGAISQYKLSLSLDKSIVEAHINLGDLYRENGDTGAAIEHLVAAVELEPDASDVHFNLAYAYEAAEDFEKATASYEKAAELNPEDPDPYLALGTMAMSSGKLKKARGFYLKALEIAPGDAVAAYNLAQVYVEQKKTPKALEQLASIAEMEADGTLYAQAAMDLRKLGDPDKATALFEMAIKAEQPYLPAHIILGNQLAKAGDFERAAAHFEKYLQLAPDSKQAGSAQKGLDACRAKLSQ